MNKNKLKELFDALDALSDDVKDWGVDMISTDKPTCDTSGGHAGLISIVAENLPELQDIYNKYENQYDCEIWAKALAVFLGFKDDDELEVWAWNNPRIWGNNRGYDMFMCEVAFKYDSDKGLTHRDIIEHWKQVLVNIEA